LECSPLRLPLCLLVAIGCNQRTVEHQEESPMEGQEREREAEQDWGHTNGSAPVLASSPSWTLRGVATYSSCPRPSLCLLLHSGQRRLPPNGRCSAILPPSSMATVAFPRAPLPCPRAGRRQTATAWPPRAPLPHGRPKPSSRALSMPARPYPAMSTGRNLVES
jgi:hypothetical protein